MTGGRVEANIAVESSTDEGRTLMRTGDVQRYLAGRTRRQVLFLQEKRDLLDSGQATAKDRNVCQVARCPGEEV